MGGNLARGRLCGKEALMPELPEVETVMRGLRAVLEGRRITHAETTRPDLRWPFPDGLARRLTGARVTGFRGGGSTCSRGWTRRRAC
jgi:hypothetical protein